MLPLRLITDHNPDPVLDTALSTALLLRVASGEIGPTLRLFTPGRIVAFGSQDRTRPGYAAAVETIGGLGYTGVERLAGGKAAVFHEGTIAFAWSTPHPDPKIGIEARFEALASIVVGALARLGIAGSVGEVTGEYCPGRFSVHTGGRKVMGVGQRLVRSAAHVGGLLVVHSPNLINRALVPAYRALGYEWSPDATGAIGGSIGDAMQALTAAFSSAGHRLTASQFEPGTLAVAANLADRHLPRIR